LIRPLSEKGRRSFCITVLKKKQLRRMYGKIEIGLYREKLTKEIINSLRENYEYIAAFDSIIVYYDYGQIELAQILLPVFNTIFSNVEFRKIETNQYKLSQVADLICTVEAIAHKVVLTKSEAEFFYSKSEFKKKHL